MDKTTIREFECYICKRTFKTDKEPCMHYDEYEMDDKGEVSLCDGCIEYVMNKAKENNTKGLSTRFFNCC